MINIYLTILLLFSFTLSWSQDGNYFTTHYQHSFDYIDNQNNAILQDHYGVLYFANRRGVLKFDGGTWDFIATPSSVYSFAISSQNTKNTIFLGGKGSFGFLDDDETGSPKYYALSDSTHQGENFDYVSVTDNKAYFLSESFLIAYDISEKKIVKTWHSKDEDSNYTEVDYIFQMRNNMFAEVSDQGLFKLEQDSLVALDVFLPDYQEILFAKYIQNKDKTLIGTSEGQFYWFDGKQLIKWSPKDQEYLEKSQPIDVVSVGSDMIAFATLRGGCIFINSNTGSIEKIVNYQAGLPDNELFSIATDASNGIWVAHEYGITRIDTHIPFKSFSDYQGLQGRVLSASRFEEELYLGTSNGLYRLEEIKDFNEVVYIVQQTIDTRQALNLQSISQKKQTKKESSSSKTAVSVPVLTPTTTFNNPTTTQKPLNRLQKKLLRKAERERRRKERREKRNKLKKEETKSSSDKTNAQPLIFDSDSNNITLDENNTDTQTSSDTSPKDGKNTLTEKQKPSSKNTKNSKANIVKKSIWNDFTDVRRFLALKSVKYAYRKVKGIDSKCKNLVVVDDVLWAGTNTGLYRVKKQKAKQITKNNIHFIHPSKRKELVYLSSDVDGLMVFGKERDKWVMKQNVIDFDEPINRIAEDEYGKLWVCGQNYIYGLQQDKNHTIIEKKPFLISNPFGDELLPLNTSGKLYFIMPNSAYYYDESQDEFKTEKDLIKLFGENPEMFSHNQEVLWTNDKTEKWKSFGKDYRSGNFIFLNLLEDVEQVIPDATPFYVWIVTKENKLYRFDTKNIAPLNTKYPLKLNYIRNAQGKPFKNQKIKLDYKNQGIVFSFTTPEYLNHEDISYSYQLIGQTEDWTPTSNKGGVLSFNKLAPGKYKLRVKSKNTFNHQEISPIYEFKIQPPYWRSPWFYGLEVLVFGMLVLITSLLNHRLKTKSKVLVIVRQTLTILTLIMCVEFLKVVLESYVSIGGSPVIDFGMEVLFALLIFPFERFFSHIFFNLRRRH